MDSSCSQGFPQRTASYPTIPEPVDNLAAPAACGRKAVLATRGAGRTSPSRICAPARLGFTHACTGPEASGLLRSRQDDHRQVERARRSEEHTSELQSLMRTSYAVFCLKKKTQ